MVELKVAVVGAGSISREFSLEFFGPGTNSRVVAIVDLELKRAELLARDVAALQNGGKVSGRGYRQTVKGGVADASLPTTSTSLEEVLVLCDAVYIGSTPASHAELVCLALQAGKHVLIEKPLAATMQDADAIVLAAERATSQGLHVGMDIGMRWNAAIHRMRCGVDSGELGTIRSGRLTLLFEHWPREWQMQPWCAKRAEGGALKEVGTHFVFGLLEVLGERAVQRVRAEVVYPDGPEGEAAEQSIHGELELRTGGVLALDMRCGVPQHELPDGEDVYELELIGDNCSMVLYDFTSLRCGHKVLVSNAEYGRHQCVEALVSHAVDGQIGDNTVTAAQGRATQAILDAIIHSNGKWQLV